MTQPEAINLRFAEKRNTQNVKNARKQRLGGYYCGLKARKMLESKGYAVARNLPRHYSNQKQFHIITERLENKEMEAP